MYMVWGFRKINGFFRGNNFTDLENREEGSIALSCLHNHDDIPDNNNSFIFTEHNLQAAH